MSCLVIGPHAHRYGFPNSRVSRFGAWGGALLLHLAAVLALVLGWPEAQEHLKQATPIEVRLLEPAKPPAPVRPLPPIPPKKVSPLPRVAEPLVSPLPAPSPLPVMATTAPTVSPMVESAVSASPSPVVVAEPARPTPPAPEPLIEAHFDADYLSNPKPSYPRASRRLGEAGAVHLRVQVGAAGQVLKLELKRSSGYPRLDQSALETVARWHFVPARRGATAVASWVVVPIVFSLN